MLRQDYPYGEDLLVLTLDRPQARNALDGELVKRLRMAIKEASQNRQLRALVVCGANGTFCAGADLGWMKTMAAADEKTNQQDALELAALLDDLSSCPIPTIALVTGVAFGGGLGLIAVCDIVLASEDCRFAFSEVRLGLIPAVIAPYVIRACGHARGVAPWIYTGEVFTTSEARRLGLVHDVCSDDDMPERVRHFLGSLRRAAPQAVRRAKALLHQIDVMPGGRSPRDHRLTTATLIAQLRASPEGREGIQAFLDKRRPQWPEITE